MSSGPEMLQEFWRTWEARGGRALVERYDEFFTEAAEWRPPMRELTKSHYIGSEGIAEYVRDVDAVLRDLRTQLLGIEEIAPEIYRIRVHMRGHGRVSDVPLDAVMTVVARIEDGKIALAWASYDPEAAQRAEDAIVHGERVPA
ncbi:MAG TPA: nuclear transport factor 2 family protein [Solirubrobacterales bacterium]|nr:nuclear transport factor 2 family protein [Solirubrobacterales bacterium]